MSIEPALEQTEAQEQPASLPFPTAKGGRFFYGLFVTALPAFSFWVIHFLKPEWQNGEFSSYVILSLFPEASLLFFPLLAYSVVCYWLLLWAPSYFSRWFSIRAGIYTGVLLAFQYSILLVLHSLDSYIFVLLLVGSSTFIGPWLYRQAVTKWTEFKVNAFLVIVASVVVVIGLITGSIAVIALALLTMAAPFLCFLIALRAAIWLFKNYETQFTLPRGFGITAWIAAYAFAWRYDILKMFELYNALPTQPPNCYIATAAAQGHSRLVGSHTVQRADGLSMQVNGQLQVLKFAELALLAVNPRLHIFLRRIYDVVGKSLARRIHNPFLADFAYLMLKPFEWLARWLLKVVVPEIDSLTEKIYTE
jgi:hypothetical protein